MADPAGCVGLFGPGGGRTMTMRGTIAGSSSRVGRTAQGGHRFRRSRGLVTCVSGSAKRNAKSFIIQPASDGFDGVGRGGESDRTGWSLWQESESGSVLIGTRRARRRQRWMSDRWRKILAEAGVEGVGPEDVHARLAVALERLEGDRERCDAELRRIERGNKGGDVCAAEVKRLKVRKLRIKDDVHRLKRAAAAAAEARMLGEGSFGRVFLGRDVDTRADVAIKVEDVEDRSSSLELEHAAMTRVMARSGPAGFPRVHFFGEQRVFNRPSRVLVMDLLGPSLEDLSWEACAGGAFSATTVLMIADQALARIAAVHRAGVVHRDIKPDNLLLGPPGRPGGDRTVHLVDFGLAVAGPGTEPWTPRTATAVGKGEGEGRAEEGEVAAGTSEVEGTPRYTSVAAARGQPPTYADDLEALVFSLSYLRAGTTRWVPPEVRGDLHAVLAAKAEATEEALAASPEDAAWMWGLLVHARGLPFGAQMDLGHCRGLVRSAFATVSGGRAMRDVVFDWEEANEVAANQSETVRRSEESVRAAL